MKSILGLFLLIVAILTLLLELSVLAGVERMPLTSEGEHAAWWVHALLLVIGGALARVSWRMVSRGYLGRLVRGRGFTPAER